MNITQDSFSTSSTFAHNTRCHTKNPLGIGERNVCFLFLFLHFQWDAHNTSFCLVAFPFQHHHTKGIVSLSRVQLQMEDKALCFHMKCTQHFLLHATLFATKPNKIVLFLFCHTRAAILLFKKSQLYSLISFISSFSAPLAQCVGPNGHTKAMPCTCMLQLLHAMQANGNMAKWWPLNWL